MRARLVLRSALLFAMVGALGLYIHLDLGQHLSFARLQESRAELQLLVDARFHLAVLAYFLVYVAVTAASVPGALILTLAGGALFGLVVGVVVVSFASTLGATLAFLASRFIFGESVQRRLGSRLTPLNRGIEEDGAFYLFTLRLTPVVPFFLINLGMGLTRLSVWKYYWVSQLGMFPATLLYVNAGTQLAKLSSPRGLLSPTVILSLTALGLFPWLAKLVIRSSARRRRLAPYQQPKTFEYNVVVIGAGAGGLIAANVASTLKARVLLVEKAKMGGDCLNTGCVPSKTLLASAKALHTARTLADYGGKVSEVSADFGAIMRRVQDAIARIEPKDSAARYSALGVDVAQAEARVLSPYQVELSSHEGTRVVSTRAVIVATGARPRVPELPGLKELKYLTSDTVWQLERLPQRLCVLGAGPVGCELAQAFQRLGSDVTLVEQAHRVLPRESERAASTLQQVLSGEGVRLLLGHRAQSVIPHAPHSPQGTLLSKNQSTGEETTITFDSLLVALGREARTQGFGLEELGIELRVDGTILANSLLETNLPGLYVCGDVTGPNQLTHMASHQAWYAAVNALFRPWLALRQKDDAVPHVTFTDPEIAQVGRTAEELARMGRRYQSVSLPLSDSDRAITDGTPCGHIEVLTAEDSDSILGVTIVGTHAGELLAEFTLAMKHNLGLKKVLQTIHPYPTYSELNRAVAGEWLKSRKPKSVLQFVERFLRWRRR